MRRLLGRVLHLIDTTGPGGAETVMLQLADGLHGRGWDAHVVVVGPGWVHDNLSRLGMSFETIPTRGRLDWTFLRQLRATIRRRRIQLVQAHLLSPAVYASAASALTGVPVVASFHGASDTDREGFGGRIRYRLIGGRATVVCVSEALEAQLLGHNLVPPRRTRVIHNGVDLDRFAKADGSAVRRDLGLPQNALVVAAVGNVRPAKDYETLLRAAALLPDDMRVRFVIAGEMAEPLSTELLALRDRLGLTDRVAFLGFRSDVPEFIKAADVLAISSSSEGFSLAAVQAMAAGTPVIATRSGGPERILTDDHDGVLVPIRSASGLAEALRCLLDDPARRQRLAREAMRTARARFSLESMLDNYELLYSELTGISVPSVTRGAEPTAAYTASTSRA